jgi:chemotaxis protein CheX
LNDIPAQGGSLTVSSDEMPEAEIGPVLQLPAVLDLKAAGSLAAAFLAMRGADITIDAKEVQRLGGQCLQVLLAAQASWREDRHLLRVRAPSAELRAALALFGTASGWLFQQEEPVA